VSSACDELRGRRATLSKELEGLPPDPREHAAQVNAAFKEIQRALELSAGDPAELDSRLRALAKRHPAAARVIDALRAKLGTTGKALDVAGKKAAEAAPWLGPLKKAIDKLQFIAQEMEDGFQTSTKNPSDQLLDFADFLDRLGKEISGLKDLDEAHKLMGSPLGDKAVPKDLGTNPIREIAKKVRELEGRNAKLNKAVRDVPELGKEPFGRWRSAVEVLADRRRALAERIAELDRQIAEQCADARPADDPCHPADKAGDWGPVDRAIAEAERDPAVDAAAKERDEAARAYDRAIDSGATLGSRVVELEQGRIELVGTKRPYTTEPTHYEPDPSPWYGIEDLEAVRKANPALARKLIEKLRERLREIAKVEEEIAKLNDELATRRAIYRRAFGKWRDAVRDYLRRRLKRKAELDHLRDCHPEWALEGGPRVGNRVLIGGGAGIFAALMIGLFIVLPGGGEPGESDAAAVTGGDGSGQVYSITGPVSEVSGCGDLGVAPEEGSPQEFTVDMKLTDGVLTAALGNASIGSYNTYSGELREDGSFTLDSDGSLPADIAPSQLNGQFDDQGNISGSWTFGFPGTLPNNLDDAGCVITVEPLDSAFYFGVTELDWREAFGVDSEAGSE
jgi:hypothetical protein